MIKRNGQRIAAIAMAAAIMGQSVQPIFALEREEVSSQTEIVETVQTENDEVTVEETETEEVVESADDEKEEVATNSTIDFKVLATRDLHANLMNYDYYTGSETNNSGLVKVATLIKEQNMWALLWPLFLFPPVISSLVGAIIDRNPNKFCIPLLVTGIYCFIGMCLGIWHPTWILFLAIPVYYGIFSFVNKK